MRKHIITSRRYGCTVYTSDAAHIGIQFFCTSSANRKQIQLLYIATCLHLLVPRASASSLTLKPSPNNLPSGRRGGEHTPLLSQQRPGNRALAQRCAARCHLVWGKVCTALICMRSVQRLLYSGTTYAAMAVWTSATVN